MNLDDLKAQRRWVGFRSADDKAPMNPHTGRNALIIQTLRKAMAPRAKKRKGGE